MYQIETETLEDTREGKPQLLANIETWKKVADYIATTFGPYGLDKMFVSKDGGIMMTNDGATILKRKKFSQPAARLLVSISENQDDEVGDGTTSVVLLASELLQKLKPLIKESFPLEVIVDTLEFFKVFCLEKLETMKIAYDDNMLHRIAETAISSKILKHEREHFGRIVVEAMKSIDYERKELLGIKKVPGGSIRDSFLVQGVAFEKCFTYAGYEQQPKMIRDPKVACLSVELEWKAERDNAEVRISDVNEYQRVVDAEWKIIRDKLDQIIASGANVVLSSLPIGDYATQYFARRGVFCSGRVEKSDLQRVAQFCGCVVQCTTSCLKVGTCEAFEERQIGKLRYNFFTGGPGTASTILLRGPGAIALDEVERSLEDALMVVRKTLKTREVVCGAGSVEMQLSRLVREKVAEFDNKQLFVGMCIAQSLEVIPFTLATNFGLDATAVVQQLRKHHSRGDFFYGIDLKVGVSDVHQAFVFEPLSVKQNMIKAAFSAASSLVLVDSTIIARKHGD